MSKLCQYQVACDGTKPAIGKFDLYIDGYDGGREDLCYDCWKAGEDFDFRVVEWYKEEVK